MRIVIIGEFSSFAKNLSDGFRALGHECFVFSWGDGFKKIEQERLFSYTINQNSNKTILFGKMLRPISSFYASYKLKKYVKRMSLMEKWDVVLVINQIFIKQKRRFWSPLFTIKMIESILHNPNNIYLSACGRDIPYCDYWSHIKNKNSKLVELLSKECMNKTMINHHKMCMRSIKKVIPIMYDYAEAWRKSSYGRECILCKTIPLPVNCGKVQFHNHLGEKVYIFHGITRPKHKGSDYIIEAMDKLKLNYPDDVICEFKGGIPLNEYLNIMDKANVVIDQTYSYGYGMNALYGLAEGKIVLSGNEIENQQEYSFVSPVVNIKPDVDQIYKQLEYLIQNRDKIKSLSIKSREYAEHFHNSEIIAQQYISIFEEYNN